MSEDNPTEPIPAIPQPDSADPAIQRAMKWVDEQHAHIADRHLFGQLLIPRHVLLGIVHQYAQARLADEGAKRRESEGAKLAESVRLLATYPPLLAALTWAYQEGAYDHFASLRDGVTMAGGDGER